MTKQEEKRMAERLLAAPEEKLNRNIKDSVFCDLFSRPEYLLQLYRALHPEDTETGMEDITLVTLSRVVAKAMYNDLGDVQRAIRETIRICKEQDVLKAYLEQEEAAAVMFTLADQDKAWELTLKEEREEGIAKGTVLGAIRVYHKELELPVSAIIEKVKAGFGLSQEDAEKYVDEALGTGVR